MIRSISIASLALCAGCSGSDEAERASDPGYATQLTAPSPDYAAMDFSVPVLAPAEFQRDASEPPPANAKAIGDLWAERLSEADHIGGMGLIGTEPDGAIILMDILLTAKQFDAWVAEQGGDFPRHINLRFQNPLVAPAVTPEAQPLIRYWPASKRRTGLQNMAALGGRIVVSDGCFFYIGWDNPEGELNTLAWFLSETGLDVDDEGYLVLVDRNTGHLQARVGEEMGWAGPNPVVIGDEQKAALFEACGEHEIVSVGNPQANEKTYVELPHTRPVNIKPAPGSASTEIPTRPPAPPPPPPSPPPLPPRSR